MKNGKRKSQCCSVQMLEVIPSVMCALRAEIRNAETAELSAQQFRVLYLLNEGQRSAMELADCTHSSRPAMSRLIDGHVAKGLVGRVQNENDRRQVVLTLNSKGAQVFSRTSIQAQRMLLSKMKTLPHGKRKVVSQAMQILGELFPNSPLMLNTGGI